MASSHTHSHTKKCVEALKPNADEAKATRKSSQYYGVYWAKKGKPYEARVTYMGKYVSLGRYHDEQLAARIYDQATLWMITKDIAYTKKKITNFNRENYNISELLKLDTFMDMVYAIRGGKKLTDVTSKYIGVFKSAGHNKYEAQTRHEGHRYSLGIYADETDAARAYDKAIMWMHYNNKKKPMPLCVNFTDSVLEDSIKEIDNFLEVVLKIREDSKKK